MLRAEFAYSHFENEETTVWKRWTTHLTLFKWFVGEQNLYSRCPFSKCLYDAFYSEAQMKNSYKHLFIHHLGSHSLQRNILSLTEIGQS